MWQAELCIANRNNYQIVDYTFFFSLSLPFFIAGLCYQFVYQLQMLFSVGVCSCVYLVYLVVLMVVSGVCMEGTGGGPEFQTRTHTTMWMMKGKKSSTRHFFLERYRQPFVILSLTNEQTNTHTHNS